MAARPPRGGDGRFVLRDRVEYSRAHCVWWFVSVDPNHADVACPCGVLERRVVACRTLDELRDQCLFVGRAAVEVSIQANPPRQGSARRREASRRPRRAGPRRRRGRAELPSPRSPPASPSRTGLAQSTRWPARLPAAHPTRGGTASLRCSGCSTRGGRFRSSRGFSGATPPWSRRARRRSCVSESLRQSPCGRTLTGARRSTEQQDARHVATEARPNHRWRCRETAQALSARFQRNARTVSVLG